MNKTATKKMQENRDIAGLLDALKHTKVKISKPAFDAIRELDLEELKQSLAQADDEGRDQENVNNALDAIRRIEFLLEKCGEWDSSLPECFKKSRDKLIHRRIQHYLLLNFDGTWDEFFDVTT